MPAIHKRVTRPAVAGWSLFLTQIKSFTLGLWQSCSGGMTTRFGLWEKLRKLRCLDPRKDKWRGYGPEVTVGQLIYALCTGRGCLSDSEALNDDLLARQLFGVSKFADQTQVGGWLREQTEQSGAAMPQLLCKVAGFVLAQHMRG